MAHYYWGHRLEHFAMYAKIVQLCNNAWPTLATSRLGTRIKTCWHPYMRRSREHEPCSIKKNWFCKFFSDSIPIFLGKFFSFKFQKLNSARSSLKIILNFVLDILIWMHLINNWLFCLVNAWTINTVEVAQFKMWKIKAEIVQVSLLNQQTNRLSAWQSHKC